jgi:5-methylcytosine-specific restriction endonuclease McrA
MKERIKNRFSSFRRSRDGKEILAVMFVEAEGKCPKCQQHMILSYEDKTYENRATFNHIIHLTDAWELALDIENLEILCWKCNMQDGRSFNHVKPNRA